MSHHPDTVEHAQREVEVYAVVISERDLTVNDLQRERAHD